MKSAFRTLALPLALLLAPAASPAQRLLDPAGTFDRAPWYAGRIKDAPVPASTVALPLAWQRGAEQPAMFEPSAGEGAPAPRLVAAMQAYLDSLMGGRVVSVTAGTPPDVRFGCERDAVDDDCAAAEGARPRHAIQVVRGSAPWRSALGEALAAAGARHALLVTLEVGEYWPRQTGLRGGKVVELGAGRPQPLAWLTSLDDPVQVLQFTGALVDARGTIQRIGAEGILAKRTPFRASVLGVQALLTDEDVAQLQADPQTWQAALRSLLRGLGGDGIAPAATPDR